MVNLTKSHRDVFQLEVFSEPVLVEEWVQGKRSCSVSLFARHVLQQRMQDCCLGNLKYSFDVISGQNFPTCDRITQKIDKTAKRFGLNRPPWQYALLLADNLDTEHFKTMNVSSIVVMHQPIMHPDGPNLFGILNNRGSMYLGAYFGHPGGQWLADTGFAYVSCSKN